jgi:hypothetical protein
MTTGTVLVFVVTGTIALVAIVAGIWLETRMPELHAQWRASPDQVRQLGPEILFASAQPPDLREPAGDGVITRGRHRS